MRYGILLAALFFVGCEMADSGMQTTESNEESYADHFLNEVELKLMASGASKEEAAAIRSGAKGKIDSLTLVNVDTNDANRVSSLGLEGAMNAIESMNLSENQHQLLAEILPTVAVIRLSGSDKDSALENIKDMLKYLTEFNPDAKTIGITTFHLQKILVQSGIDKPERELIKTVLTGLKNAAVDLSSDPDAYYYEKFAYFAESYFVNFMGDQSVSSDYELNVAVEPFLAVLPEVFDFTQETVDYSQLIFILGSAGVKAAEQGDNRDQLQSYRTHLRESGREALSQIYGDSTEAAEILDQFEVHFAAAFENIAHPEAAEDEPKNEDVEAESCESLDCQAAL